MISVIIPTLNEEKALPRTLACVSEQSGEFEVIVVDGGSHDGTAEVVRRWPFARWLQAPQGRATQMNAGAAAATGGLLLFLHADTRLPAKAISRLNQLERDPTCQAGGFHQRFSGKGWPLRMVSWLHNQRCRSTGVFYGDQAMFVRRSLFLELGGFPEEPILEDILLSERLQQRTRPVFLDDYVITDSRKFEQMGVWRSLMRCIAILICYDLRLPITARRFFEPIR